MDPYFFLYVLGFAWLIFAVVQDLRTREIANWLTFSLIIFALGYRAIYSLLTSDNSFFLYGLIGVVVFMCCAYLLYYGRAFAGGDAKLLVGLGGIIPFESAAMYVRLGGGFLLALFLLGAVYSLIYTVFIVAHSKVSFKRAFSVQYRKMWIMQAIALVLGIGLFAWTFSSGGWFSLVPAGAIVVLPVLFAYLRTVEHTYMIHTVSYKDLTEGDWLVNDVRVRGKVIAKTVHGLTQQDIALLRKARKSVVIREGVPFSPAFLFAYSAMLFYVLA